jgi:hypothetical protein
MYIPGGSMLTWILLSVELGHYRHLTQLVSTIEAKLLAHIFEGIMLDSEFEVLRAATMKSTVFWFVTPYSSERPRRFGGASCRLLHLGFLIGLVFGPEDGDNTLFRRENLKSNVILEFCVFSFLILWTGYEKIKYSELNGNMHY